MTPMMKALRYVGGGLVIGAFWYINKGRPPWEEALRTIIVFSVVMVLVKGKLRNTPIDLHIVPMIATKAVLVIIAAAVETSIVGQVSDPALVTACGLGIAVILVGLVAHRFFFTMKAPPAREYPTQPIR